jgi:DNA-binding CsgD family transcriptional regulator
MAIAFDGPVRALRCAVALRDLARQRDMALRAGIHTGEVEIVGDDIGGAAVHVAARIAAVARSDEILVSSTVRDLVPGSGLRFANAADRLPAGEADTPALLILGADDEPSPKSTVPTRQQPNIAQLSPRERDILGCLARGMTNAQTAAAFSLSEHTVKRHVANILTKLDLPNRAAAAVLATQQRLP